jgi:hypothetical protein
MQDVLHSPHLWIDKNILTFKDIDFFFKKKTQDVAYL